MEVLPAKNTDRCDNQWQQPVMAGVGWCNRTTCLKNTSSNKYILSKHCSFCAASFLGHVSGFPFQSDHCSQTPPAQNSDTNSDGDLYDLTWERVAKETLIPTSLS